MGTVRRVLKQWCGVFLCEELGLWWCFYKREKGEAKAMQTLWWYIFFIIKVNGVIEIILFFFFFPITKEGIGYIREKAQEDRTKARQGKGSDQRDKFDEGFHDLWTLPLLHKAEPCRYHLHSCQHHTQIQLGGKNQRIIMEANTRVKPEE